MQHVHDVVEVFGEIVEIDVGEGGVRVHSKILYKNNSIVGYILLFMKLNMRTFDLWLPETKNLYLHSEEK